MKKALLLAFALVMVLAAPTWADTITFTGNAGSGTGSVVLGSTLSFTGGPLDQVKGLTLCASGCAITGGSVTLTSGTLSAPATITGNIESFTFNAGGSLILSGSVSGGPSGQLLSANFANGGTLLVDINSGISSFNGVLTNIVIDKYFGVAIDGSNTETMKISLQSDRGTVRSTGTTVDTEPLPTPEPATLSMLGAGLVGLAGLLRKKLAA